MESLANKLRAIEKDEIIRALEECNFVKARAARKLGISARVIGYRIRKYGIRITEVRSVEDSGAEQRLHQE